MLTRKHLVEPATEADVPHDMLNAVYTNRPICSPTYKSADTEARRVSTCALRMAKGASRGELTLTTVSSFASELARRSASHLTSPGGNTAMTVEPLRQAKKGLRISEDCSTSRDNSIAVTTHPYAADQNASQS